VPLEGARVGGAATPRAPSAVCLLFIALNINKEKDNANGVLSFITLAYCPGFSRSARTGLIFTRIQEGTQPGGLTPPGQTAGYSIPCAAMLGSGEGERGAGTHYRGSGALDGGGL